MTPIKFESSRDLADWKEMLWELLGWSEERVISWALRYKKDIEDEKSLFYHESSEYYICPLLIPKSVSDSLAWDNCMILEERISDVICKEQYIHPTSKKRDWPCIRAEINDILSEYNSSLEECNDTDGISDEY